MKVYVASKFENQAAVKQTMELLRRAGHTITHDWTREDASGIYDPNERDAYLAKCAAADVDGVLDADAMILLHRPEMRGAYIELGVAITHGVRVYVVDGLNDEWTRIPIFYRLPEVRHMASAEDAVALLTAEDVE